MGLMEDIIEYLDFCDDMIMEMKDSKASDYKIGIVEGMEMATSMLRDYLIEYPDFVDPRHKYDKFKL